MRVLIPVLTTLTAGLILLPLPARAQEPTSLIIWLDLVNEARLGEALAPYSLSARLTVAAQRHAADLAANQTLSHTGSDGSTPGQRITQAGYAAWAGEDGELIVSENIWTGQGTIEDALTFFLEDPAYHDNIFSPIYREIGIGAATDADGASYYVLDFGARPNVLPIFINEGATNTDNSQVAIRLTNEDARPGGKGANLMGQAIEIRISNELDFTDLPWQSWEPLVPWTLPDTPGEHAVYVQFRDAGGRTSALQSDTIVLGEGTPTTPLLIEALLTPDSTAPSPEAATTLTPADVTPEPPPAAEPISTPAAPDLTPLVPGIMPFPTWTPLPTATPEEAAAQEISGPDAPLGLLAALQGLVIILSIYLILRRGGDGRASA